jgi:ligand-binding SRPBCC domain-containing protein
MKVYRLNRTQELPIDIKQAWEFFSSPQNLNEITPPSLNFRILTKLDGQSMYAGQIIHYIVSPFLGIPMRWTTEITHVKEQVYFVDEQRFGPYAFWHHKHFFKATHSGVLMTDVVDYALPMGWFGRLANRLFIGAEIERIFFYRNQVLAQKFGSIN